MPELICDGRRRRGAGEEGGAARGRRLQGLRRRTDGDDDVWGCLLESLSL